MRRYSESQGLLPPSSRAGPIVPSTTTRSSTRPRRPRTWQRLGCDGGRLRRSRHQALCCLGARERL